MATGEGFAYDAGMKRSVLGWVAGGVSAVIVVAACTSSTSSSSSGTVCSDYFSALSRCTLTGYPASEVSRLSSRWATYCQSSLGLPGVPSSLASTLDSCAKALTTASCTDFNNVAQCNGVFTGTLAGGAGCLDGDQCQSGACSVSATATDGGAAVTGCGKCDTPLAVGAPCGMAGSTCVYPATCGLAPGATTLVCTVTDAGPSNPPVYAPAGAACGAPTDGGFTYVICEPGLACGPSGTCVTASYAAAGPPCNQTTLCLVGSCSAAAIQFDGGAATATCPTVIGDGQPCTASQTITTTCDTFAQCLGGTCQLALSGATCQ